MKCCKMKSLLKFIWSRPTARCYGCDRLQPVITVYTVGIKILVPSSIRIDWDCPFRNERLSVIVILHSSLLKSIRALLKSIRALQLKLLAIGCTSSTWERALLWSQLTTVIREKRIFWGWQSLQYSSISLSPSGDTITWTSQVLLTRVSFTF